MQSCSSSVHNAEQLKNLVRYTSRYTDASCSISRWCIEVALVISSMMSNDLRVGVLWLKYPIAER